MAEKDAIIIKKKIIAGGHGHHGGAWKVAYADFVTAMMCFFLVMWLMGSDEEIKAAVAHYFNHPNTPYKAGADPMSEAVHPMGEKEGAGDSVTQGQLGQWPEDVIERAQPVKDVSREFRTVSQLIEDLLSGRIYGMDVEKEYVRFSLPDSVLFANGSADLSPEARESLDLVGRVLKGFKGQITIAGHTDELTVGRKGRSGGGKYPSDWELSFARARNVMDYLTKKHGIDESRIVPLGSGNRYPLTTSKEPADRAKNRRVEFTLSYDDA